MRDRVKGEKGNTNAHGMKIHITDVDRVIHIPFNAMPRAGSGIATIEF